MCSRNELIRRNMPVYVLATQKNSQNSLNFCPILNLAEKSGVHEYFLSQSTPRLCGLME